MNTIILKGREIPLLYTVFEMKEIQEDLCPLGELFYRLLGSNGEDPEDRSGFGGPDHLSAVAKLVRIMGNAGLEEAGENPDLTEKKIMRAMKPAQITDVVKACSEVIREALESEVPETDSDEPKDVVLEKLNKKKEAES